MKVCTIEGMTHEQVQQEAGPIYTLESFWVNFRGGRDVTREISELAGSCAESADSAGTTSVTRGHG